jgi:hypothetical protein
VASIKIAADVDFAEFLELKAKFDEYMVALAKAPAAWRGVGQELAKTRTKFETVAASATAVAATVAVIEKSGKSFYEVTTATARHWHNLALSTASVAKNIVGATESLLKWTGIVGLVTGGAGLFGFDRLAHSVAGTRQAALGTGGDYGSRQAFAANFRRFGDPEGLLSRVATAQSNIQSPEYATLRRLAGSDLKGDPTEVAIKALEAGAKYASEDKRTGLQVGVDPRLEFFDQDTRRRLRDRPEEVAEQVAKHRALQKSGRLNVSDADQKAYQDFVTQVGKAGTEIETVFVKGLVKLAGPLGAFSESVVKLVDKFLDKALPAFIDDLRGGVEWLSIEVTKDSFVKQVEGVVAMIGDLAVSFGGMLGGLARFAKWLGVSPAEASTPEASGRLSGYPGGTGTGTAPFGSGRATPDQVTGRTSTPRAASSFDFTPGGAGTRAEHEEEIRAAAIARGIDPSSAMAIAKGEGLGTAWGSGIDQGTSFGDFQLHRGGPGSVGYEYEKTYGPMKPQDWKRMNEFGLNWAAEHGWGAWSSRNKVGVGDRGGLEGAHAAPVGRAQRSVSISSVPGGNINLGSGAAANAGP